MSFKRPILAQLQNDLVNHLGNSSDILNAAVQQLAQVLASKIIFLNILLIYNPLKLILKIIFKMVVKEI